MSQCNRCFTNTTNKESLCEWCKICIRIEEAGLDR